MKSDPKRIAEAIKILEERDRAVIETLNRGVTVKQVSEFFDMDPRHVQHIIDRKEKLKC